MCLSTAYSRVKSPDTIMAKNITQITFDGDEIILTDLMDEELRVSGKLSLVDLVNGLVIIDTNDT
ncbi:MAG: CooT family nickel-binding protein [Oscillospiraceae bacterium]|jgi:predicted RNA-binding protein|nr:CooT family nickel-binding protein [Oscillospiraceae bacterium]